MKGLEHSIIIYRVGMELDLNYVTLFDSSSSGMSDWGLST